MELTSLKDRKYVYNTGKLPGFKNGGGPDELPNKADQDTTNNPASPITVGGVTFGEGGYTKNMNYQNAASAIPGLVGSIYNSWTNYESQSDIENLYVSVPSMAAGIGYTRKVKPYNCGKLPKYAGGSISNIAGATASGASIGSIAGPVGSVIGGAVGMFGSGIGEIISSDKQKRNELAALNYIQERNAFERSGAVTKALLIANAKQYGNLYNQLLYGHKNGKIPGYAPGKLPMPTYTVNGPIYGLKPNAMGAPGETLSDGKGHNQVLPGMPSNNDVIPINVQDDTTVVTNKKGLSQYYQKTGDLAGVQAAMAYYKKHGYKNGKMPGYEEGWLGNAIPSTLGSIAGLAQYINAKRNKPYYPKSYSSNPYELEGLTTLAGLRVNPYPIIGQLRSAEARTNRAIDIAGGLSGGQRSAARLAALNTTQNNISNLLSNMQQLNNAYKAAYAQAAINAGDASRKARMSANQWDYDMYAKAHAARNRGIQTGIANMLSQIQQYQANEFKRRQFNETMDLYRADQKQRNEYNNWMKNTALNINNNADPIKNPGSQYFNQLSPYEKWMILLNRGIIS